MGEGLILAGAALVIAVVLGWRSGRRRDRRPLATGRTPRGDGASRLA